MMFEKKYEKSFEKIKNIFKPVNLNSPYESDGFLEQI